MKLLCLIGTAALAALIGCPTAFAKTENPALREELVTIPCFADFVRDQIPFDYSKWMVDEAAHRQMVVDMLWSKAMLGKTRSEIEKALGPDEGWLTEPGYGIYRLHPAWRRCGNQPKLHLEVQYEHENVIRYRATYFEDGMDWHKSVTGWVDRNTEVDDAASLGAVPSSLYVKFDQRSVFEPRSMPLSLFHIQAPATTDAHSSDSKP